MKTVSPIRAYDQIKLLSDPRRLEILRLLMASPATLTQLARAMRKSAAWVRHHILALQSAGLVELAETRVTGKVTEKFYRARADALLLQEVILPKTKKPTLIFSGSHDLAVETLAAQLDKHVNVLAMPVGSLDGLVHLRQGLCQVSGAHLLDDSGEYNTPFVRHLFPDREVEIVTLAHRTQGLMLAAGNPKGVKSMADLARRGVRFVNRNPGSGTRLWIDKELARLGLPPKRVDGYERTVATHSEAASLIQRGKADASIGLQAAAEQHSLAFIPLFEERYDFVLPRENETLVSPLLDHLQTAAFRAELNSLKGYNPSHSGEKIL